jgi:hypothetical protein
MGYIHTSTEKQYSFQRKVKGKEYVNVPGSRTDKGYRSLLFLSHSYKDEELRNGLLEHLSVLQRRGLIKGWYDRQI